jgi:hypothetical protein
MENTSRVWELSGWREPGHLDTALHKNVRVARS